MKRTRVAIWVVVAAAGASLAVFILLRAGHWRPGSIVLQGAVIRRDDDAKRELPIAGATITASDGTASVTTQSDSSGYFRIMFRERVWPGESLTLSFRHAEYRPVDLHIQADLRVNQRELLVAAMQPVTAETGSRGPQAVVSNVRIRYTVNFQSQENIGTEVRTFPVVNNGNVLCKRQYPCSPDGMWKASANSVTLDAGANNEFRNVRVSCFAGPCPFTRVDSSGFEHGGRSITASALNWSDTATFLLEAEVFRDSTDSSVRESYPVIFGRVLYFTLPANQEGVSIEAEIAGTPMVFPLGTDLYMSWATCNSRAAAKGEASTVVQCELKPGYRF